MKIYKNTHKGAPLMDAIDEYASNYEKRKAVSRIDLSRWVKAHIAAKLRVPEKEVTDKDLAYFVRRMGVTYLIRQTYGMTAELSDSRPKSYEYN